MKKKEKTTIKIGDLLEQEIIEITDYGFIII